MIKIIDNFFNKKDLKIVQDFATTKAFYEPQYFDWAKEKNDETFYGNRYFLDQNPELYKKFIKQAESKFQIKINKIDNNSCIDMRNVKHFNPHTDHNMGIVSNILIMLSGPTAVTNGTVFYYGNENNCNLDMHVGFRENRAIMFPSNKVHSNHASDVPNLKRFTSTLFIQDYETKL